MKKICDIACSQHGVLDIFIPESNNGRALFFVHGGGWHKGGTSQWHSVMQHFAGRGYVCASASYRLSTQELYPAQLCDVGAAFSFFEGQASEFGFKADSIIAIGSSAGAHLVLMTVLKKIIRPRGMVLYCPVSTLINHDGSEPAEYIKRFIGENPQMYFDASPYHQITEEIPPVLILHGTNDLAAGHSYSDSMMLADKIAANNGVCRLFTLKNAGHGFGYGVETDFQRASVKEAEGFIDSLFASTI